MATWLPYRKSGCIDTGGGGLDEALGRVVDARKGRGRNVDYRRSRQCGTNGRLATGEIQTAHSVNPVPLVYKGHKGRLSDGGNLADVAPTLLAIIGIEKFAEMTGRSLLF